MGLSELSWEREMDLQLSPSHICRFWADTPDQHRQTHHLYRRMRISTAQRELSRNNRERFVVPGYAYFPRANARSGFAATATRCSPRDPTFGTRATMGYGGLEKTLRVRRRMKYIWSGVWTTRGRSSFLSPQRYTTSTGAVRGFSGL